MTSIDTPEVQDPQNPQGQPMPGPPPGTSLSQPPPVLPRPVDEHDLEQSVKLIRQALHHKSQEIDLLYLQHMAAQGQLGQYQAEQMQQATGNNMQVEAELMSQGLPLTDVRSPQSRQAYEDWHADFSARAIPATPEMAPQVDAIQKRYQDFHDTAKKYDQDKEALRSFLSPTVRTYEHGFQNFADVANKAASGLTGGYFGTTDSRVEQIASELKDKVEELTNARYPNLPWNTPEDKGRRESYQRLLSEEAFAQLKKVADRPGLHPGKATEFAGKAAELLGMAIPMGAAAKAGQAVTGMAGAAKTVVGKMAQHVGGDILGFAAYGAAIKPNKDQQQRIESLPPGDKGPGELAARVENAIDFGLFAPLYSVAGAIGRGAGSMGKAGSMVGHTAAGVGIGAMMPVAGELADQLKAAAIDSSPALQDLVQRRLIARPSLQGPVRGMDASFAAGDWPSFWANAKDYIKEAAPGMAAFGLLGFASGLASARPKRSTWDDRSMDYKEPDGPTGPSSPKPAQEAPKLPPPEVEKAAEQAHKEVDKFAGGDENLAEALHDVVDRKAIELIDESQPPKTQVDELGAMVGPAEARRQSTELVDVKDTTPWSERPKATTPGGGNPQRIADLRQEAALLERKLKRAKPGKQAAIESRLFDIKHEIRDEYVKEGLRPAADYAVKPADYASEIRSRGEKRLEAKARVEADPTDTHAAYNQELWRGAQQALRYKRVAANATSPQVRQAAQQRASAWTLYGRQLEAWNAGKQRGESPTPPYFERMTPEGKAEAQDFHATEAFNASMEKVPPQQRAAGEVASYRESPQRIVDEANASGDRAPGMVVQTEDGRKVTVASHEQGETRAVNEDGDLEQVEGGKVLSLGQAPTVAPDAVRDAQGQVDAAHVAGQAAPPEAARTVIAAQEAAQAKASDPATNVSQDPFEAKVIRQEAEKSSTSTAAERIVRQAELATGRKVAVEGPKAGDVPPRPPTPETTPHTEFPKETADLAKLESLAASVAGAARGPYGMLCELKEGRSKRSLQDAVNYLDAYLAREGIPEEHRQFAEWAKDHAEEHAGKTGERFGAELLNGYLEAAVGREHTPFTETLQDLARGLDTIELLPKAEQQRQFVGWAAAEAESLTGPWSVAARYTWAGKKILDRVQRLGDPLNSQRGSVINPLEWPVQGVAAIGKALWNWRGGVRRRLMEQMSREPKTTAGLTRKVFGGYFETFGNWGGRICREAIAADTKSHAELERVKVDMFHATSGLLSPRRWQEGTAKSKALFQVLDQGLRGKVAKSLLPKAKAGDLEATDILKTAIALKRWMRGTWKIATDVHPTTLRLREHLHYLAKDIASLEGERAPKQAELDASKAFGATHAELADVNKRLLAAKKDARKWFGGLKGTAKNHKAPKGTPPKALDELRREAREMGSRRAAIYRESGIKLPEVLRGVVGGLTRRIRAMKGQQRALAGELERFRKSYGIKNYVKHASILEILPGGVARDFTVDKNGVSSMEARRRIYSDSTMHRDEWLRTKGLLHEDGVRAMWHYIHSIVPYIHRSRFLSKIDRELYGDLTLLPFREVAMGGGAEVHFGDLRGLNLGLHDLTSEPYTTKRGEVVELPKFERTPRLSKEERAKKAKEADERRVAKAAGLEVPEVPDKGHVLLWVGDPKDRPSKAQLGDVRWVSRHMQTERNPAGGLLAIPKGQAILRAFKGGWWERADAIRQGDMVKAINLTVGALSDQQRGMMDTEFGRILKPLNRIANTTAGIVSANVLGGFTNAHNALNNLFAATIQNAFFFGGRTQHAPTSFAQFVPRYIAHVAATIMRSSKTTTPKVRREKGREALSVSWDEAFRTPKEKLDKLSPEKRAAQQLIDDCHVAFMQSGAAGANHANYNFGQPMADVRFGRIEHPGALRGKWESARAKLKWVEGELEKVEPGIAAKIGQTLNNLAAQTRMPVHAVKRMWYALFSASEIGTRFPPFAKGYLEGRERGLSHDQALAEGLASLHLTQVVFSKVAKSDYLRSPFGKVFGNLQTWTTMFSGRMLSMPKRDIAAFAAFSAAIIALAQTYFGLDWWDMLGTRVSNVPIVGPKANSLALGIGTRTEADPSGATPKGPIYDAGIRSLAVPLPLPVGVGPSAKVITDLIGAAVEWYQGNGEAAAKHLNAARAGFDPTKSNWVRQMEKAFGESNVPQSDGTALYVNKDTGKGSTILTQRGWLEYAKLMLPGTDLAVAQQWQENELSHAASEQARKSNQEFSALGKDWTHALIESQSGDPAAKALEQELRAELVHQAKQLGKKVSYATWHDTWLKDAEWERNSDMRLRTAVSAPDKISKVRELTRLVEDPNYPLSRERFLRAATFLGGKKGFADWLADVPMAEKVKLDQAVKRRMVAWER